VAYFFLTLHMVGLPLYFHSCQLVCKAGSSMSCVPSLSHSYFGALLTPAPLNISGVPNVVMLPAMAGAIFYCADVRFIQVPCDTRPNRTLLVNSFSSHNLGIADLQTAALSSANGFDALSSSKCGTADLRATAQGFADGSPHHQQLPEAPLVNLSSTAPASRRELFNIPKLPMLTENKPLGHQCNVHETERKKRRGRKQDQHGPKQETQDDTPKPLSEHHVSKATWKPRKRNLDPHAVKLLQVLLVHSGPAICS
jgi:hypothetical protein